MCRLKFASVVTLFLGTTLTLAGQAVAPPQTQAPPESARQALLGMLLAKPSGLPGAPARPSPVLD